MDFTTEFCHTVSLVDTIGIELYEETGYFIISHFRQKCNFGPTVML